MSNKCRKTITFSDKEKYNELAGNAKKYGLTIGEYILEMQAFINFFDGEYSSALRSFGETLKEKLSEEQNQ